MMTIIKALTLSLFLNGAKATTENMKLKNQISTKLGLNADAMGSNESCTASLDRLAAIQEAFSTDYEEYEGSGNQYSDRTFEGTHALYWPSFLSDAGMANTYNREVTGWARPSEMED